MNATYGLNIIVIVNVSPLQGFSRFFGPTQGCALGYAGDQPFGPHEKRSYLGDVYCQSFEP